MNHWRTKTQLLMFFALCALTVLSAQEPLSRNEALAQLYNQYDAKTETAQWVCPKEQASEGPHEGWPCAKEYATVSIDVLLTAQVPEDGFEKTYLVTSAVPDKAPGGYDCEACEPAIGAAVFAWRAQHWVLESANPAIGFFGGLGDPAQVDLVHVGWEKHGLQIQFGDDQGGYSESHKVLFIPLGKTISQAWSICDEQDDAGAYDPTDKWAPQVFYHSSAAILFFEGEQDGPKPRDYYDIEVISRGTDLADGTERVRPENWTAIYRFDGHQYKLLKRTTYREIKSPQKTQ